MDERIGDFREPAARLVQHGAAACRPGTRTGGHEHRDPPPARPATVRSGRGDFT